MKRTIAAIVAADIAGYSRLIAQDEEDTLARFKEHCAAFRDRVAHHGGRVFNTAGDSILAEFPSGVEALRAAIEIQDALRLLNAAYAPDRRIEFRMGITIGDVVEQDGDLLGDGVNIAARLESLAEPGGICVSRALHDAVANKVPVAFRELGPQNLKNIARPVHAFRVLADAAGGRAGPAKGRSKVVALVLAGTALGLAGALWAAWPLFKRTDPQPTASAAGTTHGADRLTVSVVRPQRKCFADDVTVTGVLAPRDKVDVRASGDGLRVTRVLVDLPAQVTAGQVLAHLTPLEGAGAAVELLRAPVDGTVGGGVVTEGALVSQRSEPLFQIAARGEVELLANVSLANLRRLVPGQTVTVTPLGLPGTPGRVRAVSTTGEGATQQGRVRIALREEARKPDEPLRWGTFARGVVSIGERCGMAIPFSALAAGPDGMSVYVAANDKVEARPVTTGLSSSDDVEVREGLGEGDVVVRRAGAFLREGDLIRSVSPGNPGYQN